MSIKICFIIGFFTIVSLWFEHQWNVKRIVVILSVHVFVSQSFGLYADVCLILCVCCVCLPGSGAGHSSGSSPQSSDDPHSPEIVSPVRRWRPRDGSAGGEICCMRRSGSGSPCVPPAAAKPTVGSR